MGQSVIGAPRSYAVIASALAAVVLGVSAAVSAAPPSDPRPIAVRPTVFLEQMTWMEVRDALRDGRSTVIVPTGGIEQNGPYVELRKHDLIVREAGRLLAERLGDALVAPVISFVPQGSYEPPEGHLAFPGTIGVRESTFEKLLEDVVMSLKVAGFARIILIGDSHGNQRGLAAVAGRLDSRWRPSTRVRFLGAYYNPPAVDRWLRDQGIVERGEGIHDTIAFTSMVLAVERTAARVDERRAAGKLTLNGVSLEPIDRFVELGRKAIELRVGWAIDELKRVEAAEQQPAP